MPKDSKIKKSKGKPSPFKGKAGGNNAERIKARAIGNAQAQKVGPVNTPPGGALVPYGQHDKHVHKISRGLYTDELLPVVEKLASQGLTNAEIAESLGVGNRTFYEWRDKYPHFAQALAKYRGVVTSLVENAFIQNCLGYEYVEQQMSGTGVVKPVMKWHPGETRAQSLYLFNHMGQRYKNKIETVHTLGAGMEAIAFALKRRED